VDKEHFFHQTNQRLIISKQIPEHHFRIKNWGIIVIELQKRQNADNLNSIIDWKIGRFDLKN
jgi:hypothetical protein